MQVKFHATLRMASGGRIVDVDIPMPATALALLQAATQARPALQNELWKEPGTLKDYIHVFVNGRDFHFLPDGLETSVQENDMIDVFPAVGGG